MIRVEQPVFDALKQLRKTLAPVIKFKTMSELVAHLVTTYSTNPVVPQTSPERLMILELRRGIYDRLGKLEELLMAQAAGKTVTMTIDNLVGTIELPKPQADIQQEIQQAIVNALRDAQHS